mgnify:CR=1 FL=1
MQKRPDNMWLVKGVFISFEKRCRLVNSESKNLKKFIIAIAIREQRLGYMGGATFLEQDSTTVPNFARLPVGSFVLYRGILLGQ